jgi:hypothetical protein
MSETSDHVQRVRGGAASVEQMAGTAGLQFALGVNLITSYYPWRGYAQDDAVTWLRGARSLPQGAYRAYCDYVGRLGVMLRGGRHVCPAAVYYPVRAMQALFRPSNRPYHEPAAHGEQVAALDALVRDLARGLLQRRLDFDFVDDEALAEAEVGEGALRVADERYRLLILPAAQVMERRALASAVRFAQSGGAVITVESLPGKAARSADAGEVARLAEELRAAGVAPLSLDHALAQAAQRASPEIALEPASPQVLALHRVRDDGLHLYFLTNTAPAPCEVTARLSTSGDTWICWPRTGAIESAPRRGDHIPLSLGAYEGVFVVARP